MSTGLIKPNLEAILLVMVLDTAATRRKGMTSAATSTEVRPVTCKKTRTK